MPTRRLAVPLCFTPPIYRCAISLRYVSYRRPANGGHPSDAPPKTPSASHRHLTGAFPNPSRAPLSALRRSLWGDSRSAFSRSSMISLLLYAKKPHLSRGYVIFSHFFCFLFLFMEFLGISSQNSKIVHKKIGLFCNFSRSVHDIFINLCYNVRCETIHCGKKPLCKPIDPIGKDIRI